MLGVPHAPVDSWRLEAMAKINGVTGDQRQFHVKTFDYKDTLRTLEAVHDEMWDQHNLSIAQFGSKLQSLGTALFCHIHPEIRLWFAVPKKYNATQYSEGCKATWVIELGSMPALRSALLGVGKLRIDD
jgi:predicted glycoside hydrolase/deacetylase ChbG (UPF0249 family)